MKYSIKYYVSALLLLLSILSVPLISNTAMAAGGMSFNTTSATVLKNGLINFTVRGTGTNFNVAQVNLSFDTSKLRYVSHNTNGSVLPTVYVWDAANYDLTIGSTTNANGTNATLANFTFEALTGSGNASISLGSGSDLIGGGVGLGASIGSPISVTFTSPAPPPTPPTTPAPTTPAPTTPAPTTPAPTTPTPTTPAPTTPAPEVPKEVPTVVAPNGDTTAPVITSYEISGFVGKDLQVLIKTNEPTTASVRFGNEANSINRSSSSSELATDYKVSLGEESTGFANGNSYYYLVEAVDASGNKTVSAIKEFILEPTAVTLVIKDDNGELVRSTTVYINDTEYKTDENGEVKVENLVPGIARVSIKKGDSTVPLADATIVQGAKDQTIEVSPTSATIVSDSLLSPYIIAGTTIAALLLLCVGIYKFIMKRSRNVASVPIAAPQMQQNQTIISSNLTAAPTQPQNTVPTVQQTNSVAPGTVITPSQSPPIDQDKKL
jgi:hypothetical protein